MHATLFALLPLLAMVSAVPVTTPAIGTPVASSVMAIPTEASKGKVIMSGRDFDRCLSIEGGAAAVASGKITSGTPVVTVKCNDASLWDISPGSGSVVVTGTAFALDIGLEPANHGGLKVWQSYPTAPQQTWFLTGDLRIAQTGGDQCIDQGDNGPQTYACTTGNTNQIWFVATKGDPFRNNNGALQSWSVGPATAVTPAAATPATQTDGPHSWSVAASSAWSVAANSTETGNTWSVAPDSTQTASPSSWSVAASSAWSVAANATATTA